MYYDNIAMYSESKITHSFTRALASYNQEATVQKECANKLGRYLINCLTEAGANTKFENVFEFGCGTGFLSQQLIEKLTISKLVLNDLVKESYHHLPPNVQSFGYGFIHGDIDTVKLNNFHDLICSASCVQWSKDLPSLLQKLNASLSKDGYLAISSFTKGHFNELSLLNHKLNENNPPLNYWTIEKWQEQLPSCFEIQLIKSDNKTQWFNSVRDVLLHLRLTGVNGNTRRTWHQQDLVQFEREYEDKFSVNKKIPLTYCPIYIIARKLA